MKTINAIHLGDGAYVSRTDESPNVGSLVFTANHHDPRQATDRVFIEPFAIPELIKWIKDNFDD